MVNNCSHHSQDMRCSVWSGAPLPGASNLYAELCPACRMMNCMWGFFFSTVRLPAMPVTFRRVFSLSVFHLAGYSSLAGCHVHGSAILPKILAPLGTLAGGVFFFWGRPPNIGGLPCEANGTDDRR